MVQIVNLSVSVSPNCRERVGTAIVLLIWGAYSEAASLVANVLYTLPSESAEITKQLRAEIARLAPTEDAESSTITLNKASQMQYMEAVCYESLRVSQTLKP